MKIVLEDEEIEEALKKYVEAKLIGNPEVTVASRGDFLVEFLISETKI